MIIAELLSTFKSLPLENQIDLLGKLIVNTDLDCKMNPKVRRLLAAAYDKVLSAKMSINKAEADA